MLFNELNLCDEIMQAIDEIGYIDATEIQSKAIPLMLDGKDIVGKSNTGTGKTAAFGIPLVQSIKKSKARKVSALILCPTRELAVQACGELNKFAKHMPWVKTCAVYGGASMEKQINELKRGANIVVGTPGRIMDHINRGTLILDNVNMVVLDEADEMLNMGFREDIETILAFVPDERQTALFSATMPPEILAITHKYQNNPIKISIDSTSRTVDKIDQYYFEVPMGRKTDALCMLISAYEPKLSMVFCNTKAMVDELTDDLIAKGFKVAGLHGDMKQQTRTQVLDSFKKGKLNILIATDVAARGIDIDDVDIVFNYDLPQDNEYYIHRIGRTGRAGKSGRAYTILSGRKQLYHLKDIARYCRADIRRQDLPTRDEVIEHKIGAMIRKAEEMTENGLYEEFIPYIEKLEIKGISLEMLSASLLKLALNDELESVPEFIEPVERVYKDKHNKTIKQSTAKIEISQGRKNRIAPNFILGALVEATGMPGKMFGKIDIFDKFSTVEVPKEEREMIVAVMDGIKINGHKVNVKVYEGRSEWLDDDRKRDDKRKNRHDKYANKRDGKHGAYNHNARGQWGSRNKNSQTRNKRKG